MINMFGVWFVFGAVLDLLFWKISSENFRDYVMFRQLKEGWGFNVQEQKLTLFKIGFFYYLIAIPIMAILLVI